FPLGQTVVTVTATDAAGNVATGAFTVTVRDTTSPALTLPAGVVAEATSAAGALAHYGSATASDAVGGISVSYSAANDSVFPVGRTTVTVTATDAAGNTTSGAFSVTVRDTTPPVLTVPAGVVAEATGATGALVHYGSASATDAVGSVS